MIVTAWRPPLVHLIDFNNARTLCGVSLGPEMETGDPVDTYQVQESIACGCKRCAAVAKSLEVFAHG